MRMTKISFDIVSSPYKLGHTVLKWRILVPPTGKFHASAQLFMLVLPHFFASLFDDTRHSHSFSSSPRQGWMLSRDIFPPKRAATQGVKNFRSSIAFQEVSRICRIAIPSSSGLHCNPRPRLRGRIARLCSRAQGLRHPRWLVWGKIGLQADD